MIKVDEVSDGVFYVMISGIDLRSVDRMKHQVNLPRAEVLRGLIITCLWRTDKECLDERSQDELDGKNEGMGRG